MTKDNRIHIRKYEQAADEKVSLDGIKWLRKWDVCVQCDGAEEAEALRVRLAQLNDFNPDWDAMAVMVEEQQRMAKRIEELTQLVTSQGIRLMDAEAQPEQEPVAWKMKGVPAFATSRPNDTDSIKWDALYTAPPQREWVGLTDDEKHSAIWTGGEFGDGMLWAEKLLKERNT